MLAASLSFVPLLKQESKFLFVEPKNEFYKCANIVAGKQSLF